MKVMILAAGRGERMRPLSDARPKPLLMLGEHALIEHQIHALRAHGFTSFVINVSYQAEAIMQFLGNGDAYGVEITYSQESVRLETGGGIVQALPLLGERFLVVSGDIVTDFPYGTLREKSFDLAHLVMVPNPEFHAQGDFHLNQQQLSLEGEPKYTFGNIGLYSRALFERRLPGAVFPVVQVLKQAMNEQRVSGELFRGAWWNIGTPELLQRAAYWMSRKALVD